MKVYLDSDVIISSLISSTGAAFHIINNHTNLDLIISDLSVIELQQVVERLELNNRLLQNMIKERLRVIKIEKTIRQIEKSYSKYTTDINDTHIVAGVKQSDARFLITYNLKHYNRENLKNDFDILLFSPALFLQYLRSL